MFLSSLIIYDFGFPKTQATICNFRAIENTCRDHCLVYPVNHQVKIVHQIYDS